MYQRQLLFHLEVLCKRDSLTEATGKQLEGAKRRTQNKR